MNITLIGMPGSGKSYIGKKLADKLGFSLIELDFIMESESGKQLQSVLEELGEELFLERQEEDAIKHTIDKNNLVISPGGSIIYSSRAMEHLKHISKVIYLKTSFETIEGRIQKTPRRIVGLKEKTLQNIFDERTSLYERWADIVINAEQDEEKLLNQLSTLL